LTGKDDSPVWQVVNIFQASQPYKQLIHHPMICEEIAQLLSAKQVRLWHDQIQYKPSGQGGVNMWHQDSPLWPVLSPKTEQVTAWVALDDVDADNGCMSMIPTSHQWGNAMQYLRTLQDFDAMPSEFEGKPIRRVLCPVKKGHVHYHHSLTWHGSHANKSDRPRRAIALHYMNERTCYSAAGSHPMKPFITVADGQPLQGESFPVVWRQSL
jgi:ectoine hydroxylase-related dioxygenase (phytanoyl-CoA dioxygenase family)